MSFFVLVRVRLGNLQARQSFDRFLNKARVDGGRREIAFFRNSIFDNDVTSCNALIVLGSYY